MFTVNVGEVFGTMTVTSGLTYTFKYVAENVIGLSEDSDLLIVAFARPPSKPSAVTFDEARSTRT